MKMLWFCLLLTLGLVSSQSFNETAKIGNIIGNPCTDKNHFFLAPGVLTAGGLNRACVSRFYTDGPAHMTIRLLTENRQTVTAFRELPPGDGGCLDINVPQLPNTKADLVVNIRYPEAQCVWERRLGLRISSGRVVVISTERARYRPGELVRLRVLALKQDLAPSHGLIEEIWLEGPHGAWEGSRVTQWQKVRTRLGLAQLQYQLDELAPTGRWTLRARLGDGSQGSAVFWVGNYELPPFQLSVRHAPRVLRTSDKLVWTVCVRYPWSEAVEGMLVIRLRGAGGGSGGIRTAVQLRAPKACHRHAAAAKRVGLDGLDPPDVVVADFSFQEEGTRIWQNTTVVSQVVDKPISLEFLTKHRAVISPGLPYKLKVKATRWDDKPATKELVRVCRYPSIHPADIGQATLTTRDNNMCAEGVTDASGVARLLFAAGDDAAPFYRFEAHLSNDTTTSAIPLTLPVRRSSTVHAALGPLKAESRQARTLVPLYLNTNVTAKPITVHFVVITRGGIIYRWGATTQCPTSSSSDHIHTTPRNSICNANYVQKDVIMAQRDFASYDDIPQKYAYSGSLPRIDEEMPGRHDVLMAQKDTLSSNATADVSDALLDRHQLRVMLPIKVSHQMCPDSHLIAYFYHEGELVSASKHFEMDECFVHKVEATWLTRQAQPGSTVSLQVSTPGPALCALTVLDSAAKWTHPLPSAKEQLIGSLRRLIDSHRNLTEYDAAGLCFLNADTPEIPSTSIELTSSWLAAAGVRLLGGDAPVTGQCAQRPPALLVTDEATVPRSDFSEAWLWRLLAIGGNGTGSASARAPDAITRFEAGAVCVSRGGTAISNPAVLQVFREFFIHADSPKRLRRGDSTIIRYRIFNYLYEPLSVQIQILTDPHVQGPKEVVESACVRGRSSIARRAELSARLAAPARVRIRAKAVSDGNCGNITSGKTGVSDEVIIRIAVDPEGVPVREQKSILLCGNSSTESSISEVTWTWPPVNAVTGTETLTVWTVGDVTGPLLADADSLLLIPRGCGEQNMAQLATNLLALQQLEPTCIAALTAKEHVARGLTRQLQYVHPSGGFSAFGPTDATSSTWLTAFVVKHMRRAHKLLWPNIQVPSAIIRAERWLLNQQMENGCFRNEGQVFHRELRGGLNDEGEIASVGLTAYVITALMESSSPLPYRVIGNTLSCLRAFPPLKSKTPTRVYAHALLAYAYMKLEAYEENLRKTNEASLLRSVGMLEQNEGLSQVLELLKVARRNGDYVWWEASSLSTSIEATAYALMAIRASPLAARCDEAAGASRWLAAHRGPSGGFVSTQDTLVALEALTAWSSKTPTTNLNVTARCSGLEHKVTLQPGVKIPDILKMRPGERLSVAVEGTGCALVQATRSYNTLSSDISTEEKQLSVQVAVHTDGPFDCDSNATSCFCAAVIEACVVWSGSFPEMALLEVTLPGGYGADAQLLYSQLNKPTTLLRRIEVTPRSTRATLYLGTRDGSDTSGRAGHQCYNIHATGPRTNTRPAYARVQDYYVPSVNDTQVYTIPEECPPRISHDSNEYRSSDNLYTKARALDTDEIVINHEYSFEDIPEGIPLEDPLFDNLTQKEQDKTVVEDIQEIGRLEKLSEESNIYGEYLKDHNNSEITAEHINTYYKSKEKDHITFDNIVIKPMVRTNEDPIIDQDEVIKNLNNFSTVVTEIMTANDGTTKAESHNGNADGVKTYEGKEKDRSNIEDGNVSTNFDTEINHSDSGRIAIIQTETLNTENDQINFEASNIGSDKDIFGNIVSENSNTQKYPNNFGTLLDDSIRDNGGIEKSTIKTTQDTEIYHSTKGNDLRANIKMHEKTINDHNNIRNGVLASTGRNEFTGKDILSEWGDGEISKIDQGTINYYSNFGSVVEDNIRTNESAEDQTKWDIGINAKTNVGAATTNIYRDDSVSSNISLNKATEKDITNFGNVVHESIIDQANYDNIENVKFTNNAKNDNNDAPNNIVQEIDSLNKFAYEQLNESTPEYDVDNKEYKNLFTHDNHDKINNNNRNPYNTVENYNRNEELKNRENEIKRSYKDEKVNLKPQTSEKIIPKPANDLKPDNNKGVDNPALAEFQVIDSEKDLDVPTGVEGPIPSVVLPPPGYIPPTTNGDSRRLLSRHRPHFERPVPSRVLPPPNFVAPPSSYGNSKMQRLSNLDFPVKLETPISDVVPPPFGFALSPVYSKDFRRMQDSYSPYAPPLSMEGPISSLSPEPFTPARYLGSLQSIYTSNGPYFYFKEDSAPSRRLFIPVH